jgi:hypothetical protein
MFIYHLRKHSKTNEEKWLKLGQIKFYLGQKCAQIDSKK